jgi:hypothetical protein
MAPIVAMVHPKADTMRALWPLPELIRVKPAREISLPLGSCNAVGEREFLRGPLSREAAYRLMVSGEFGAKELAKIIKVLTLQKELLLESEAEDDTASEQ